MSDTVVDSSVVAKWILAEPDSAHAQRLISEVALKGERLIVLDLAFVEVTNAIWKLHHRGLSTLDEARQLLDKLLQIPVHVEPAAFSSQRSKSPQNTLAPSTTHCL
jgi:predicted nucleic acid-binding protein